MPNALGLLELLDIQPEGKYLEFNRHVGDKAEFWLGVDMEEANVGETEEDLMRGADLQGRRG